MWDPYGGVPLTPSWQTGPRGGAVLHLYVLNVLNVTGFNTFQHVQHVRRPVCPSYPIDREVRTRLDCVPDRRGLDVFARLLADETLLDQLLETDADGVWSLAVERRL